MRRILVNIIVGFLMLQMLSLFIAPTSWEKIDIVEEKEFKTGGYCSSCLNIDSKCTCFTEYIESTKEPKHLQWWNTKTLEEQFYCTIECNHLVEGDKTRHPHTLKIHEIKNIYNYFR